MHISIVVPYPGAEREAAIWADEERNIDFRRDIMRAARCTTAFAAMELKRCLERTLLNPLIRFDSRRSVADLTVELQITDPASKNESFCLQPVTGGMVITGQGRTGLLYGAYEWLRLQGWRWFAPGQGGEIVPDIRATLVVPEVRTEYAPAMTLGRGFDFEGVSKESAELLVWMARNRLNISGYRWATGPLGEKLGMSPKTGGHIFEKIINPDRILPSGQTLWTEHQNWYGLPADGRRRKETALRTQFCVSQPDLRQFLGEELLVYLMGEWQACERVDVWGFDTWGSTCACDACRSLGNSTDQTLYFLSAVRDCVNTARRAGRLDHDVRLVMCSYEGTATLPGPERPVPPNLIAAGDYVVFYPINRCYAHDFTATACPDNRLYHAALQSWFKKAPAFPVMAGEYYNVSKFEDLPLLFTTRIMHDLPGYYAAGVRGITYMHIPLVNWGMRTLTQLLYAQLAWDSNTSGPAFIDEYFTLWYGPYAQSMRKVYSLIEEAWCYIAQWRSWSAKSILSQLRAWDGAPPKAPLTLKDHFDSPRAVVESGRQSSLKLKEALALLNRARDQERDASARTRGLINLPAAVNPVEARKRERINRYEMRLGEDRRLLLYGIDVMTIMTELVAYHDARYRQCDSEATAAWQQIEAAAESLDSYFIPIAYEWPGAGLESRDALTRSQVRELLGRCRAGRMKVSNS